jgi:hypothetical protein
MNVDNVNCVFCIFFSQQTNQQGQNRSQSNRQQLQTNNQPWSPLSPAQWQNPNYGKTKFFSFYFEFIFLFKPIRDRTVPMVHHQLLLQMQHGKSLRILKEVLMVKDVLNQAIQPIRLMRVLIQHNIHILVGIIIKLKLLKDQLINIIMERIHQLVQQVHLLIKHQLVTIISRPIRHLRLITIVNKS